MKRFLRISPLTVTLAATLLAGIALAATPALRVNSITSGTVHSTNNTAGNNLTISAESAGVASGAVGKAGGNVIEFAGNGALSVGFGAGNGGSWMGSAGNGGDANNSDPSVVLATGGIPSSTAGYGGDLAWYAGRGGAASSNNVGGKGGAAFYGAGPGGLGSSAQNGGDGGDLHLSGGPGGAAYGANGGQGGDVYIDAGAHGYGRPDGTIYMATTDGGGVTFGAPITQYNVSTVGTTQAAGYSMQNNILATSGVASQYSPGMEWMGQGWNTTALASQTAKYFCQLVPVSSNPITSQFRCMSSENGAGYTTRWYSDSFGNLIASADLYAGAAGQGVVRAATLNPNTAATAVSVGTQNTSGVTIGTGVTTSIGAVAFGAGATASGSTGFDLSGSSGIEKTTTGAFTIGASSTTVTNSISVTGSTFANGGVVLGSALRPKRTAVADAGYTALSSDTMIAYTSISAARVVAVNCTGGSSAAPIVYVVKDESGSASGTNTITITPSSGTIDGSASKVCVNSAYGTCRFYAQGTNCFTW